MNFEDFSKKLNTGDFTPQELMDLAKGTDPEILKELVYNDNLEVAVTAALNSFMPVEELLKIITGPNVEEDVRNEAYANPSMPRAELLKVINDPKTDIDTIECAYANPSMPVDELLNILNDPTCWDKRLWSVLGNPSVPKDTLIAFVNDNINNWQIVMEVIWYNPIFPPEEIVNVFRTTANPVTRELILQEMGKKPEKYSDIKKQLLTEPPLDADKISKLSLQELTDILPLYKKLVARDDGEEDKNLVITQIMALMKQSEQTEIETRSPQAIKETH